MSYCMETAVPKTHTDISWSPPTLVHMCVRTQDLSMIWQCSTNGLILFRRGSEIIYSKEVINNPTSLTHSSIKYTVLIIPWMPTPEKFLKVKNRIHVEY